MLRFARPGQWIIVIGALLSLLVGCGGDDSNDNDPTQTETAQAQLQIAPTQTASSVTPTPLPPMTIGAVIWASEIDPETGAPSEIVDAFTSGTRTIYAVVPVSNVPENTVIVADWTYNNTSLDALSTSVTILPDQTPKWLEFHLSRSEDRWPDGTYAIAISVGDEVVQQAEIEVENQ
jgi:hypothetical protein